YWVIRQRSSTVKDPPTTVSKLPLRMPRFGSPEPPRGLDMVPPRMVATPWGDSRRLGEKTLPPGRGTTAEEAEHNHRARLYGAMVANVAEKGYEATTIEDLVEVSGVSRSAFYKHFSDKQACFLAAIEALVDPALDSASKTLLPDGEPPSDPQ